MISSVVMQPHLHLRAGYQSYRDRINNFMSEYQEPVECGMAGTYRGRSRHRLPRREGARIVGRTGGVPQYVPADRYPPGTESPQKRSRCLSPPSTWHSVPADFLAAGSNLNGGAPSFRPDAGCRQAAAGRGAGSAAAVSRNGPEKCCHVRKGRRNSCLLVSLSTG